MRRLIRARQATLKKQETLFEKTYLWYAVLDDVRTFMVTDPSVAQLIKQVNSFIIMFKELTSPKKKKVIQPEPVKFEYMEKMEIKQGGTIFRIG